MKQSPAPCSSSPLEVWAPLRQLLRLKCFPSDSWRAAFRAAALSLSLSLDEALLARPLSPVDSAPRAGHRRSAKMKIQRNSIQTRCRGRCSVALTQIYRAEGSEVRFLFKVRGGLWLNDHTWNRSLRICMIYTSTQRSEVRGFAGSVWWLQEKSRYRGCRLLYDHVQDLRKDKRFYLSRSKVLLQITVSTICNKVQRIKR